MRTTLFIVSILFVNFLQAQYNPVGPNTVLLFRADKGVTLSSGKVSEWLSQDATGTREAIPDNPADPVNDGPTFANDELTFASASTQHLEIIRKDMLPAFGTSDFTFSFRFKKTTLATYDVLLSLGSTADTDEFVFGFQAINNQIRFTYNSTHLTSSVTIENDTYYLATIVKSGNSGTLYIDGANPVTNASYYKYQPNRFRW